MAGIIAVYGLVVSVLIVGGLTPDGKYSLYAGFIHLAAGLSCGLTGLAAGHAIGIVGDAVSARRLCGWLEKEESGEEGGSMKRRGRTSEGGVGAAGRAGPLGSSYNEEQGRTALILGTFLQCARAYMFQSRIFVAMVLMLVRSRAYSSSSHRANDFILSDFRWSVPASLQTPSPP